MSSSTEGILILAPHIDDELIGCYSMMRYTGDNITVVYFEELTSTRRDEASAFAEAWPFTAIFGGEAFDLKANIQDFSEVLVPSRRDWHPAHKRVNAEYRRWATKFYSVDMGRGVPLGPINSHDKHELLNKWYPSQAQLWESDAKYYLFDDIRDKDYDEYIRITAGHWKEPLGVFCLKEYEQAVTRVLEAERVNRWSMDQLFNQILAVCPQGRVSLSDQEGVVMESPA